jgi:hypothetical protein
MANDEMVGQLWAGFKDRYGPQMRPEWAAVGDRIASRFTELGTRHDGPRCLTHNDFRPDNMMFATPEEAVEMAKAGADAIIAHVGTTVGGSVGVRQAVVSWDHTLQVTQDIIRAARQVRNDIFFLCHGGPINTPADAKRVLDGTDAVGFVGASSLERMGVEESLTSLTRTFKSLKAPAASRSA